MTSDTSTATASLSPSAFGSYRHGWSSMMAFFLELLLITAAYFVLLIPTIGLWGDDAAEFLSKYVSFNLIFFKIGGAPGAVLFSLVYLILFEWPLQYGVDYASLVAARRETPRVGHLFSAFGNFWNAVLANLLVTFIVALGFIALVVPGIVFFVKLAFVPFLIVDKKMEAVAAVKESWRMTGGHAWKIFGMALLAIPIGLVGLLLFGVGIIVSIMWINLAFASLYHAVAERERSAEKPPVT